MAYLSGMDRRQTEIFCLEDFIATDATVRVIDAFCHQIDYVSLNFRGKFSQDNCRPNYHPSLLLRLYLYGYLNGVRSSRKLAQECVRNLEVMWLCNHLTPKYHTIADFRKLHAKQIREVFREFVSLMCNWKLIGGKTIAVDGTRYRAQNSRKNNYNQEKIQRQMAYINQKTSEYLEEMNEIDLKEKSKVKDIKRLFKITQDLEKMQERRRQYQALKKQLDRSSDTKISTTDPDSRSVIVKTGLVEVSYNTQVAVDDKHSLVVHYQITNDNDRKALYPTVIAAKENMHLKKDALLTALADKGYFNAQQLHACSQVNTLTYVPQQGNQQHCGIPAKGFSTEDFIYHRKSDYYTCPAGYNLFTNGQWYIKDRIRKKGQYSYLIKQYKTEHCLSCPLMHLCTINKAGRTIERSQYAEAVEQNHKRIKLHPEIYLRRQQIVEHPFGTIKRWWGYSYTLMKGIKKVGADLGLVYLCYNLKRVMNILSPEKMLGKLQTSKN